MNNSWISDVLHALKGWQIKKILVVFICIYPILAAMYFTDELKLMLTNTESNVKVANVSNLVQSTNMLKDKMRAASISVYLYQPTGDKKTSLQRICYASDERRIFADLEKIEVVAHSDIIKSFKATNIIAVYPTSTYDISTLLTAYDVKAAYVIAIRNDLGSIKAEAILTFDRILTIEEQEIMSSNISLINLSI